MVQVIWRKKALKDFILPKCGFLNYFSYLCGVRAAKRQTDNNRQFKEII